MRCANTEAASNYYKKLEAAENHFEEMISELEYLDLNNDFVEDEFLNIVNSYKIDYSFEQWLREYK